MTERNCLPRIPGTSCSKLTMSLVNLSLKLSSLNIGYMLIILLKKKCEKLLTFFQQNTCELDVLLTRTVINLTTN